jgi:hypothetical protein
MLLISCARITPHPLTPLAPPWHHTRPAATEEAGGEVERLNAELAEIQGGMNALKAVLYAKFGDSINLEE